MWFDVVKAVITMAAPNGIYHSIISIGNDAHPILEEDAARHLLITRQFAPFLMRKSSLHARHPRCFNAGGRSAALCDSAVCLDIQSVSPIDDNLAHATSSH